MSISLQRRMPKVEFACRMAVSVGIAAYLISVLPQMMEATDLSDAWELLRPIAWLSLLLAYLAARQR